MQNENGIAWLMVLTIPLVVPSNMILIIWLNLKNPDYRTLQVSAVTG